MIIAIEMGGRRVACGGARILAKIAQQNNALIDRRLRAYAEHQQSCELASQIWNNRQRGEPDRSGKSHGCEARRKESRGRASKRDDRSAIDAP
jgi:hypothetical protein